MGVSKTSDQIKIKIKMPISSQEPPASSEALIQALEDMDVLCTFKINLNCQYSDHGYIYINTVYIQIKILIWNPRQDPPASSTAPSQDLKDMDDLCTFKIKIESKDLDHGCIKDHMTISKSRSRCQTKVRNLQCPPKPHIQTYRTWRSFALS